MPNVLLSAYDVPELKRCEFALLDNTNMTVRRELAIIMASSSICLILLGPGRNETF
jgi:hypothetical protein